MRRWIVTALLSLLAVSHAVDAAELRVLIDQDNNATTGCTVATANGDFAGVERILITTVDTTVYPAVVAGVASQTCTTAPSTFGAPSPVDAGGWPVGIGQGADSYDAIETYITNTAGNGRWRLAFIYQDGVVGSDAVTATTGGTSLALQIGAVAIPVLATTGQLALALILAAVAFLRLRQSGARTLLVPLLVMFVVGQVWAAVAIILDGQVDDWTDTAALTQDPSGDTPAGADISAVFAKAFGNRVYFRADVKTAGTPAASNDSYSVLAGASLNVAASPNGLLANDSLGGPPATLASFGGGNLGGAVTGHAAGTTATFGTGGSLHVGSDGGFSFTPATGFTGSFVFNYRLTNSSGSSDGQVTIATNQAPAITSANTAAFSVGSAGSFTVAASGFPTPTIALSGCTLPSGLGFSGNSLAGTPATGTGGTYNCVFTASNGIGSNSVQNFTLQVNQPPAVTSANTLNLIGGKTTNLPFTITTSGVPAVTTITQGGTLPTGVSFSHTAGASTAQLTGTPGNGSGASGPYTVTLTANNGVTPNATQTLTINVTDVNVAPTFTKGADQTVAEDAGPQSIAGWATAISKGGAWETAQTLSFQVTNNTNPGLFSAGPAVSATGTLTFTPAANASGSATVTLVLRDNGGTANGGSDSSTAQTFDITVTASNDQPVVATAGHTVSYTENAVPVVLVPGLTLTDPDSTQLQAALVAISSNWGGSSDILACNTTGTAITATFNAGAGTLALSGTDSLANYQQVLRTVAFSSSSDAPSTAQRGIAWTVTDTGAATSAAADSFVDVVAVNDAPTATVPGAQTINEDVSLTFSTANGNALSIDDVDAGTGDIVQITLTATHGLVGLVNPAVAPAATLTRTGTIDTLNTELANGVVFVPDTNFNGAASLDIEVDDQGYTGSGGALTDSASIAITVQAVNDAPSFVLGGNQTVLENAGAQSVNNFVTSISPGPTDESSQTVNVSVTGNTNAGLFSAVPALSGTTLTYTPAANTCGSATITVTGQDNGGTANGGVDSTTHTFTITVSCINSAPSFTKGADQTVLEDAGAQTIVGWATAISPGLNESSQTVSFNITGNTNPGLFSAGPAVSSAGVLTFTPAANANGSATITLVAVDNGGTANGGVDTSPAQTFTITVTPVNDAPSFTAGADQTVTSATGSPQTVNPWATAISAGPADETGQTLSFEITNNTNSGLFSAGPAVSATGVLTYTLAGGGTAAITLRLVDNGGTANGGVDASAGQTFNITGQIPPTITSANSKSYTVGSSDSFTFTATGYPTAMAFSLTGCTLPSGLSLSGTGNNTLSGTAATGTGGTYACTLNASNGVAPAATQAFTITVLEPPVANNDTYSETVIGNVAIDSANHAGGAFSVTANDVSSTAMTVTAFDATSLKGGTVTMVTSGANMGQFTYDPPPGYEGTDSFTYTITNAGGSDIGTVSLTVSGIIWFINNNVATTGDGRLSKPFKTLAEFEAINGDADTATVFNPAANDSIFIYESATSYAGPLTLRNGQKLIGQDATASLSTITGIMPAASSAAFPAMASANGTKVTITSAANGVVLGNTNTVRGLTLGNVTGDALSGSSFGTLTASDVSINTTGRALSLATGTAAVTFDSIVSSGGANNINLSTLAGNLTITAGALSGATSDAVKIDTGSANVTYGGTVTNAASAAKVVNVANKTSGTVTFTGAISNSGVNGPGVSLTSNTGATIRFAGGLALTMTSNPAFTATGGGTIEVCDEYPCNAGATGALVNTLTTTSGTALNVANTTIGSGGIEFRSISSNGAANGIVLNTTGSSGNLIVRGTGSAGSGGTIQSSTSDGISITSARLPTLSHLNITNNGNASGENGLKFTNVTGSGTLTSLTVTGSAHNNLYLSNSTGTVDSLVISGGSYSNNQAATGNNGIMMEFLAGTANATSISISGATISGNQATGLQVIGGGAGTIGSLTVSGNTFTNNNIAMDMDNQDTATFRFNVANNTTITGNTSHAVNNFSATGAGHDGTFQGRYDGNSIGNSGVAGSGSTTGNGVRLVVQGGTDAAFLFNGNSVRQTPNGRGIEAISRAGDGDGNYANSGLDLTVTNNDVNPQDTSGFPLAAIFAQSNAVSVVNDLRADIRNNVVPAGTSTDLQPTFIVVQESGGSQCEVVDNSPASVDATAELTSHNTGSAAASAGCALIVGPITTPP